jgi:hypothetical protein
MRIETESKDPTWIAVEAYAFDTLLVGPINDEGDPMVYLGVTDDEIDGFNHPVVDPLADVLMKPDVARELASALLVAAERAEKEAVA